MAPSGKLATCKTSRRALRIATTRTTKHVSRLNPSKAVGQTSAAANPSAPSNLTTGIAFTYYESNSFAVKFNASGARVLIDPWLVGDLVFGDADWFFTGKKRMLTKGPLDIDAIVAEMDILLLTQGLDDHFHLPTMKALPRSLPVVASPEVIQMARDLGYTNLTSVDHGQSVTVAGGLQISALEGSLVGPPWSKRQNCYVMRDSGASLFMEPHCDCPDSTLRAAGPVDVVVAPITSQLLNLGVTQYPLVQGDTGVGGLLQAIKPKVLVPLLNAEIDMTGPLSDLLIEQGSLEATTRRLSALGLDIQIVLPAESGVAKPIMW